MDVEEIEITIDKNGQVKVHVRGAKGQTCLEITQSLEEALGGEVVERELTPEALDGANPIDQSLQIKSRK